MYDSTIKAKIYTDGSCSKKDYHGFGPGGWCAILFISSETGREKIIIKGGELNTSSNKMELKAAVEALKFLNDNFKGRNVVSQIISDSQYTLDTIENVKESSMLFSVVVPEFGYNDLKNSLFYLLKNSDIDIKGIKVKSHTNDKYNYLADKIAVEERKKHYNLLKHI